MGGMKVPTVISFCTDDFNQSTVCPTTAMTVTSCQVDLFNKFISFVITASYFSTLETDFLEEKEKVTSCQQGKL